MEAVAQQVTEIESVTKAPACRHDDFSIRFAILSPFDDHATEAGVCPDCGEWLVVTTYLATGKAEERKMTAAELVFVDHHSTLSENSAR